GACAVMACLIETVGDELEFVEPRALRLSVSRTISCQLCVVSAAAINLLPYLNDDLALVVLGRPNLTRPSGLSPCGHVICACGNMRGCACADGEGRLRHKQRNREEAMNKCMRAAVAAAAMLAVGDMAHAQSFPSKPVRLLVPYPAGGAVDVLARTLGDVVT